MHLLVPAGILLPTSFLSSPLFAHFATFVAINTVIYCALSLAKILPKIYVADWVSGSSRRAATRSIYPDAPLTVKPASRWFSFRRSAPVHPDELPIKHTDRG